MHRNKKWSHFDLKSWVTGGTKVRPSRLRVIGEYLNELTLNIELNLLSISSQIGSQYWFKLTLNIESNSLSISSQFNSNILQLLGTSCRILVPPVTLLYWSKWHYFFSVNSRGRNKTVFEKSVHKINNPDELYK